eukprot:12893603-Prorocentrum_lima.AAC.1
MSPTDHMHGKRGGVPPKAVAATSSSSSWAFLSQLHMAGTAYTDKLLEEIIAWSLQGQDQFEFTVQLEDNEMHGEAGM